MSRNLLCQVPRMVMAKDRDRDKGPEVEEEEEGEDVEDLLELEAELMVMDLLICPEEAEQVDKDLRIEHRKGREDTV